VDLIAFLSPVVFLKELFYFRIFLFLLSLQICTSVPFHGTAMHGKKLLFDSEVQVLPELYCF
jgi:hypothetical protein